MYFVSFLFPDFLNSIVNFVFWILTFSWKKSSTKQTKAKLLPTCMSNVRDINLAVFPTARRFNTDGIFVGFL